MVSHVSRWSHRIGLVLAGPPLVLAIWLGSVATWDARPLPPCTAGGLDPLKPIQKCRRVPVPAGQSAPVELAGFTPVRLIEQGTVSGVPDFRSAGFAATLSLALYLASRVGGRLTAHIRRRSRARLQDAAAGA
jgi:hypothetical protein